MRSWPASTAGLPDAEMEAQLHFLKGSALNLGSVGPCRRCARRASAWPRQGRGARRGSWPHRLASIDARRNSGDASAQSAGRRATPIRSGTRPAPRRGDVAEAEPGGIHPADEWREIRRPASSRSRSGPSRSCAPISSGIRTGRCRRRAPAGQEIAQRAGALRQAQDEVFLQPGKRWARSLTSGRRSKSKLPPEVTQTTVLPRISSRQLRQHVDRQRAGRFQHDAFDVQHLQHGDADAVFGRQQHLVGPHPGQHAQRCDRRSAPPPRHRRKLLIRGSVDRRRHARSAAVRLAPPAGSTKRILALAAPPRADRRSRRPTARRRPPAGSPDRALRPICASISTATVACPSITSGSSKGDRKCAPCRGAVGLAPRPASRRSSRRSARSRPHRRRRCGSCRSSAAGVVTGMKIAPCHPEMPADKATPCAWLPALAQTKCC